ncbi:hypothetical protein GW17_00021956 [Ensete ventricosum]|nr:hypothetical protein GW17_00021956 [Ensete ventricosum]
MVQAHPWFKGTQWEKLYQMEAAFKPEVNDELDTQNFEKFEEVYLPVSNQNYYFTSASVQTSSKSGPWRKLDWLYEKNCSMHVVSDIDTAATPNQPVQGSFLKLLPTQMEVPEGIESSSHSSSSSLDQSQSRYR